MLMLLRHLLAILLMPCVVVVVVPYWLLNIYAATDSGWGDGLFMEIARMAAIVLFLFGFGLFGWCVSLFARVGQGTLAPWDPTRNIVAVGPYRFVRNPMISGVALMLLSFALFRGSWVLAVWALIIVSLNHIYFVLLEEPGLEERFGASYRVYKANVPRWIPRLTPRSRN